MTYSTAQAAARAGLTYRQIDYWTRAGAVTPSHAPGVGYGSYRRWSERDVHRLVVLARLGVLWDKGLPTALVRAVWQWLIERDVWPANLYVTRNTRALAESWFVSAVDPGGISIVVSLSGGPVDHELLTA